MELIIDIVLSIILYAIVIFFGLSVIHFFDVFAFALKLEKNKRRLVFFLSTLALIPVCGIIFIYGILTVQFWVDNLVEVVYKVANIFQASFFIPIYIIAWMLGTADIKIEGQIIVFKDMRKIIKLPLFLLKFLQLFQLLLWMIFGLIMLGLILRVIVEFLIDIWNSIGFWEPLSVPTTIFNWPAIALQHPFGVLYDSFIAILSLVFSSTGIFILIIFFAEFGLWFIRKLATDKIIQFKRECLVCNSNVYFQHPVKGLYRCPHCGQYFITKSKKWPDDVIKYGIIFYCVKLLWESFTRFVFWVLITILNLFKKQKFVV